MRVIVTRPAAQAADWVQQLLVHGIDALALPLIGIGPAADPAPIDAAWQSLARHRLVVFVSPNAAEQFFARRPQQAAWPLSTFAASPGPGTTRVLAALGVPASQVIEPAHDAPQFDSESLWLQLAHHDWRAASVLIVRGEVGRDWLAETLQRHGATVAALSAYQRAAPVLAPAEAALLATAIARPQAHLWFFSSSQSIDHLESICGCTAAAAAGEALARASALATHPRIAARAREFGFGRVLEARPSLHAVVACIQSLRP